MTPEEVAYNLALLRSSGKAEDIEEADQLEEQYRLQLQGQENRAVAMGELRENTSALFESAKSGLNKLQGIADQFNPVLANQRLVRSIVPPLTQGIRDFANDFNDPGARAARLVAERSGIDEVGQFPQSADIIDNAVAQAQVSPAQVLPTTAVPNADPVQAIADEQALINAVANQQAAEQQQLQIIAQLEAEQAAAQAQQIQFAVDQDNLLRTQENLRLLQVPQANPNDLRNIAALSQTPAITAAPNNFANTVALNQSIVGDTSPVNQLPTTTTSLQQQRRVNATNQKAQNQVTRQQQRALELARQAYVQGVALPVFQRPR